MGRHLDGRALLEGGPAHLLGHANAVGRIDHAYRRYAIVSEADLADAERTRERLEAERLALDPRQSVEEREVAAEPS